MKRVNKLALCAYLLGTAPAAMAIEPATDSTLADTIAERLAALESLTVTAEKRADKATCSDDAEVEALLAEAAAAERG